MATKKLEWLFNENDQIFSVDLNCEDYEKYGMLSFALIRYKDIVSHGMRKAPTVSDRRFV